MRTSHLLPRALNDIIFRSWLQMVWLARPTAFAAIREHLNLTQNDVGKSLGATRITISGWENGRFLPIAENAYCYWTTLLDKSKLDGKSESWLIDEIFTQIPELYDAIPKMHDARRYQCVKAGMKCDWADDPDNSYLDHAVDSQLEIETLRAFEFAEKDLDLEIALRDDEDNEAEKSYLSGVI